MSGFRKLVDLGHEANQLRYTWLRNVLTLSGGALALLVALRPGGPVASPQKYFLVASWILLGCGILFGAAATYGEVALAAALAKRYQQALLKAADETGKWEVTDPVVAKPHWVWRFYQTAMCVCLILAVISLVVYATISTLQA